MNPSLTDEELQQSIREILTDSRLTILETKVQALFHLFKQQPANYRRIMNPDDVARHKREAEDNAA